MINLLPPKTKTAYRFARRNFNIRHWVVALVLVIFGAVAVTALGYLYIQKSGDEYRKQIALDEKSLSEQNYVGVEKQVTDMSNNLTLAVNVLSKQILFSELLQRMGTIMPKDTRLDSLEIANEQKALDIRASAKTYNAATQIQVNMTDPANKLFSKADIISINCSRDGEYNCEVSIRALFSDDNPFLFINDTKGANP